MNDRMAASSSPGSADAYKSRILPLRQQVDVRNRWLKERLDNLLPELMKREGFRKNAVVRRSVLISLGECVRP